jgi:hypothetical protein
MWRVVLALALIPACSDDKRPPEQRAADAAPIDAVHVYPDAPPPTVDAPPAPMPTCTMDAGECQLPPSTCLDPSYLLYYEGGACVDGTCQFTTHLMYCGENGCANGGCLGGFT